MRTSYDDAGRAYRTENGHTTAATPAALASMTVSTTTTASFDGHGRQVKETLAGTDGAVVSVSQASHDAEGRTTCVATRMNTSAFGSLPADACQPGPQGTYGPDRITRYSYDTLDRVTQVTNGYGTSLAVNEVTLGFTPNGRLARATDARGNRTTYVLDGHDRNYQVRFPVPTPGADTSSTTDYEQYGFDAAGNVTSFRTRRGDVIALQYDNLGRLYKKTLPYRADVPANERRPVDYRFDLLGQLTSVTFDGSGGQGVYFGYDALGRQTSTTTTMDGVTRIVGSAYDAAGRRTQITHPDGQAFTHALNIAGQTTSVSSPQATLFGYQYFANGQLYNAWRGSSAANTFM